MKNEIYCSTGTVIGRATGFDHSVINGKFSDVCLDCGIDKFEYVFITKTYEMIPDVLRIIDRSKMQCAVLHAEKSIGTLLSEAGADPSERDEKYRRAMELWEINCRFAKSIGVDRAVLHLWGSFESDSNFEYNLSAMPEMTDTADRYGVKILVENVPCTTKDPMTRWGQLEAYKCGFIYDVRFGQLHGQNCEISHSDYMKSGRISHMHISDFGGGYRDFSKIRPILHPNEGKVDFPMVFDALRAADYSGSMTLESPVMSEAGLDFDKLSNTLHWLMGEAEKL